MADRDLPMTLRALAVSQYSRQAGTHAPVDEHGAAAGQGSRDEGVGGGKVLDQVLVRQVVDGHDEMLEAFEAGRAARQRRAHHADHVRDGGRLQLGLAAQRKQPAPG